MRRLILAVMFALTATAAAAEDKTKTVILSPPGSGTTIGKIDGETVLLKKTPAGTIGRIGKDKVILHSDGRGNTMAKVGKDKVFCHSDPSSGLTICK